MQLGTFEIDLERKQVLPFGATHLQPGGLPAGGPQTQKGVIIHLNVPEVGRRVSVNRHEFAHKGGSQIDEMNPLIDQLAAAAPHMGRHAPFAVVARAPAVTVAAADEHRVAEIRLPDQLVRLPESRDETGGCTRTGPALFEAAAADSISAGLRRAYSARLFHEHMLFSLYSPGA